MIFTYLITIIVLAAFSGKSIFKGKLYIKKTPLDIPFLLFLISSVISTIISIDSHTSFWGYYSRSHGGLLSTLSYLALYYVFLACLTKKEIKKSLKLLLISALVVSAYGILERLGIDKNYWIQDVQNRVFSTLGQPNWLGAFLGSLIFIPLALKERENVKGLTKNKVFYWLLYFLFLLCLIFTNSKSAILALFITLTLFLMTDYLIKKKLKLKEVKTIKKHHLIVFSLTIIIYLFFGGKTYAYIKKLPYWLKIFSPLKVEQKIETKALKNDNFSLPYAPKISESSEIRQVVWVGALNIFKAHPLIGSGLETYAYSYYKFKPQTHNLLSEWDFLYNKAHNEFLNILACQGLLGLATYLSIIFVFLAWFFDYIKNTIKVSKDKLIHQEISLKLALFLGFISLLITNFFGFSVVLTGLLFFFLPGFCFGLSDYKKGLKTITLKLGFLKKNFCKIGATFLVSVLTLSSFIIISKHWLADFYFAKAETFYKSLNLLPAFLNYEKAIKLNPTEALYHAHFGKSAAKLAIAYLDLKASEAAQTGQDLAKLAEMEISRALELNQVHLNFYKNKAEVYLYLSYLEPQEKYEAVKALEQARLLAPTDAKILYNLGITYSQLNETEKAIKTLNKAIQLKPNYTQTYLKLGEIYLSQENFKKAQEQYLFILQNINPQDEKALNGLKKVNEASVKTF